MYNNGPAAFCATPGAGDRALSLVKLSLLLLDEGTALMIELF